MIERLALAVRFCYLAGVCAGAASGSAIAADVLLEPPSLIAAGSAGDASVNQGHALSADGRFVTFASFATNLVEGDTNGQRDVFVWDRTNDQVEIVSRGPGGQQSNGDSFDAVISADGNWLAFASRATNLAADTNGDIADIFLYSRQTAELELVSRSSGDVQSETDSLRPDINANGRYITFDTAGPLASGATSTHTQIFQRDSWRGSTALISQTPVGDPGNASSMDAQMSADGQRVVFVSMATNFSEFTIAGKDSFLKDTAANSLQLLSESEVGEAGDGTSYFPSISGDGQVAAFHSNASNLVSGASPNFADVILRDLSTGRLTLISRSATGLPVDGFNIHPSLSFTGRQVLFASNASNLVPDDAPQSADIVLLNRDTAEFRLLSRTVADQPANGDSRAPSLSYGGRFAAFESTASNLGANGTTFSDVLLAEVDASALPIENSGERIAAAVLPSSRSVRLGDAFTVFASVVSTGLSMNCTVRLSGSQLAENNMGFEYQATDPATNAVIGSPDTPFLLIPGAAQTLVFTLRPSASMVEEEVEFDYVCASAEAENIQGLNTVLVSAQVQLPPDIVALAATQDGNGIVTLPVAGGSGFFSVATINVGASSNIVVRPIVAGLSLNSLSVCQTDPLTSVCLAPASSTVSLTIATNETPTFGVFVNHSSEIEFEPAINRLVVQFEDSGGRVRGRTSVAVRSSGDSSVDQEVLVSQ